MFGSERTFTAGFGDELSHEQTMNAVNVLLLHKGISNGCKIVVGRLCHIGFLMMCHTINEEREEGCMYMNQHPLQNFNVE